MGVVLVATVMREVLNVEVGDISFNSLVKSDGIFISLIIQTVIRGVLNSVSGLQVQRSYRSVTLPLFA